jgi:hypothetical protein
MKKGKAAQQLKALELRPITHQGIHRPQGGNPAVKLRVVCPLLHGETMQNAEPAARFFGLTFMHGLRVNKVTCSTVLLTFGD